MMNLQEIVVYIIGVVVAIYIGIAIYRLIKRRNDPCVGCSGCDIRSELDKKRAECVNNGRKPNPGCGCGCG